MKFKAESSAHWPASLQFWGHHSWRKRSLWGSLFLGSVAAFATAMPVRAAERIAFSYNLLEFYLPVESLETYAETGTIDSSLAFYFQFLDPSAEEEFRNALLFARESSSSLRVAQAFYSPIGEDTLYSLGELIRTDSDINGFYALRAALIQAAGDPGGATLLGVLRHYPTRTVRIDLARLMQFAEHLSAFADLTKETLQEVNTLSEAEIAAEGPVDLSALPAIGERGPYQFTKQTLDLRDETRDRNVPTDLYVPVFGDATPDSIPVVVYSHGFGETRETAAPFLQTLASYGFVVAAPQHVGSDYQYQLDLLAGRRNDTFDKNEFFNRPLDVSYVLDVLEKKNATDFNNRLNLQRVGAVGHSFGGYTVMVLGGATVDFENLTNQCQEDFLLRSLNTALLLQCRALELESSPQAVELLTNGSLRDPRIQAVLAATPVAGAIFDLESLSRITVPVLLFGGGSDPITPVVPEQVRAFSALTSPERYLLITDSAAHSPQITEIANRFLLPTTLETSATEELETFLVNLRSVGLSFMQVYVADRSDYRPYMQATYVKSLSVSPYNFSLLRSFPAEWIDEHLNP